MRADRAIHFACVSFFLIFDVNYLRICWTDFHRMIRIKLQMINPIFFSDILRDVAMATNFVANYIPPSFVKLAFRN